MNTRELVATVVCAGLLPAGIALTSLSLHDYPAAAFGIYLCALACYLFAQPPYSPWSNPDSWVRGLRLASRRIFVLLVLTTLHAMGSCPTWFLGLMIAATGMQWAGFLLVRPSRLAVPVLPEIAQWNALAQSVVLGIFLGDFFLISRFPANFRFSEAFHLAGYAVLASLQLLELAHDFFRMRRPLLFWIRALAFQPN